MSTSSTYRDGVLIEARDDATQTVTTYGAGGVVTSTRPYTAAEITAANAELAAAAVVATEATLKTGTTSQVDTLLAAITRLQADRATVAATLGTAGTPDWTTWRGIRAQTKATINADPSVGIKALADLGLGLAVTQRAGLTALISLHRAVLRLSRLVARRLDSADTGTD